MLEEIVGRVSVLRMGKSWGRMRADGRYGGIRSKHPTLAARAALDAARRVSSADRDPEDEDEEGEEKSKPLNFAQKLLLGRFY
jgi:hypothetical protein